VLGLSILDDKLKAWIVGIDRKPMADSALSGMIPSQESESMLTQRLVPKHTIAEINDVMLVASRSPCFPSYFHFEKLRYGANFLFAPPDSSNMNH
jgi:hypothetical protein